MILLFYLFIFAEYVHAQIFLFWFSLLLYISFKQTNKKLAMLFDKTSLICVDVIIHGIASICKNF